MSTPSTQLLSVGTLVLINTDSGVSSQFHEKIGDIVRVREADAEYPGSKTNYLIRFGDDQEVPKSGQIHGSWWFRPERFSILSLNEEQILESYSID